MFGVPFFSPDASARRKINTRPAINTKIPGKNVEKIPQKCDFFRSQKCVLDLPEVFFFGRFAADYSRSLPVYQDKKILLITEWLPNVAYFDQYNLVPATQLGIVTAIIIHVTQARHVSTPFTKDSRLNVHTVVALSYLAFH